MAQNSEKTMENSLTQLSASKVPILREWGKLDEKSESGTEGLNAERVSEC